MRPARVLVLLAFAILVSAACTGGTTEVQGLPDAAGPTGVTSPTGPTGATAATGGAFSLDLGEYPAEVTDVAFFTCNGVEGTWRYIFKADFGVGVVFDVDSEVNMAGGEGTLVFGGQIDLLDVGSASWTDTIDLRLRGSQAMKVTNVVVNIDSNIPGLTEDTFRTFPTTGTLAIVEGSDRC